MSEITTSELNTNPQKNKVNRNNFLKAASTLLGAATLGVLAVKLGIKLSESDTSKEQLGLLEPGDALKDPYTLYSLSVNEWARTKDGLYQATAIIGIPSFLGPILGASVPKNIEGRGFASIIFDIDLVNNPNLEQFPATMLFGDGKGEYTPTVLLSTANQEVIQIARKMGPKNGINPSGLTITKLGIIRQEQDGTYDQNRIQAIRSDYFLRTLDPNRQDPKKTAEYLNPSPLTKEEFLKY